MWCLGLVALFALFALRVIFLILRIDRVAYSVVRVGFLVLGGEHGTFYLWAAVRTLRTRIGGA